MAMQVLGAGQATSAVTPSSSQQQLQWLPVLGRQVYCPWPETATPAVPGQQSTSQTDACCRVVAQDVENFGQALQTGNLKRSVHDFMIFHLRQAFCITADDHLKHMTARGHNLNKSVPASEQRNEWCTLDLWVRERVLAFDVVGLQKLVSSSVATAQMQWWIDDCESLRIKISMNRQWIAIVQNCQLPMLPPPPVQPSGDSHTRSNPMQSNSIPASQVDSSLVRKPQSNPAREKHGGPMDPPKPATKKPLQVHPPNRMPMQDLSVNVRSAAATQKPATQKPATSFKGDELETRIALLREKRKHEDEAINPKSKRHKSTGNKSRPALVPVAAPPKSPTKRPARSMVAGELVINCKAMRAAAESVWLRTAPVMCRDGKPNRRYLDNDIHFYGISDLDPSCNGGAVPGHGWTFHEACKLLGYNEEACGSEEGAGNDYLFHVEATDPAWLRAHAWYRDSSDTSNLPGAWDPPGPYFKKYVDSANARFEALCNQKSCCGAPIIDLTQDILQQPALPSIRPSIQSISASTVQHPLRTVSPASVNIHDEVIWKRVLVHDTAILLKGCTPEASTIQLWAAAVAKSIDPSMKKDWLQSLEEGARMLIEAHEGNIQTHGWADEELRLRQHMQREDEPILRQLIRRDPRLWNDSTWQAISIHHERADLNARTIKALKARQGEHMIKTKTIAAVRHMLGWISPRNVTHAQPDDRKPLVPPVKSFIKSDLSGSSDASKGTTSPARVKQHFHLAQGAGNLNTGVIDLTSSPSTLDASTAFSPCAAEPPNSSQLKIPCLPQNYQPRRTEPLLCEEQAKVVDLILQGANVFYTGSAGCGKSTVLKSFVPQLRDLGKTVRIVAPTGRAALDINGSTTWTFAGWTPDHMKKPIKELEKAAHGKFVNRRLRDTDVLVIDEISMLENHHFERLNRVMKSARSNEQAFGGAQVIVTGDFCQLPPVKPFQYCITCGREQNQRIGDGGRTVHRCPLHGDRADDDKWAFRSTAWEECNFQHINLSKIHRQSDEVFIKVLQKLRIGTALTNTDRSLLLDHPCAVTDAVRLFSTRDEVKRVNQTEFDKLKTPKHTFTCLDLFHWNEKDHPHLKWKATRNKLDNSLLELREHRLESSVEYKQGMLVVLLVNLDIMAGLVNGSQGRIVGFEEYDPTKLPKASSRSGPATGGGRRRGSNDFGSDSKSELRGEHATIREGQIRHFISHPRNKSKLWPIVEFDNGLKRTIFADCQVNELGDEKPYTLIARTQIPLIAAWAMTIHKSQGMTLNRVSVDLGRSFEEGQEYVALSRARSLDGLKVVSLGNGAGKRGNQQVREFLWNKFQLR